MRLVTHAGILALECKDGDAWRVGNSCNFYFLCHHNAAYVTACPQHTYFHADIKSCSHNLPPEEECQPIVKGEKQEEEGAESEMTSEGTSEPPPTPSDWFECPELNGLFSHPYNCSGYFQCSNGLAYEFHCEGGLHFDPATEECNWPDELEDPCVPSTTVDNRHLPQDHRHPPVDNRHLPQDHRHPPVDNRHLPQDHRHPPVDNRHLPQDHRRSPVDKRHLPQDHRPPPLLQHEGEVAKCSGKNCAETEAEVKVDRVHHPLPFALHLLVRLRPLLVS
ncbi:unnamed protein product [Darwinula stevensoni]|uniref:Chitin-binding type-2 domain-containing protein n=1 Tax=Darwinula stevensoni TaxID=69355 RepID=A0A7R9A3I4_9CRUS|nr:unnamed protein product [Darwinula stevensoni]CAG0891705.1 unnamed protein product [Darwinula stevensoni]